MKSIVAELLNSNNKIVSFIVIEADKADYSSVIGTCYSCDECSEIDIRYIDNYEFFAEFYLKWDGCTHWWFRGEDYNSDNEQSIDAYYHLCGSGYMIKYMRLMCFIWRTCYEIMIKMSSSKGHIENIKDNYIKEDNIGELIENLLKGYTLNIR